MGTSLFDFEVPIRAAGEKAVADAFVRLERAATQTSGAIESKLGTVQAALVRTANRTDVVTGRVGVCMATSGPGATNLVTAIADAHMDSVPIVAITGQVPSAAIGTDAFQEADIRGITMPITKHSYLVTNPDEIPRVIAEAFHIASTGRPGL